MTSKQLQQEVKRVKKIEKTIKLLESITKQLTQLERTDFDSFRIIISDTNKTKWADELFWDAEEKIKALKNLI